MTSIESLVRRTRFLNLGLAIRSPEQGRANLQKETSCHRTTHFGRVIVRRNETAA